MSAAPPLPRHRRRSVLLLGIALTCFSALAAAFLFTSASHRVQVLVAARNIPVGTVITQADLAMADISGAAGVASIPGRQEPQVTGEVAAVDVRAGTLLAPGDLTTAVEPVPGQALVPVAVKTSQIPASGLAPGDTVLVIPTPGAAGQASAGQASAGQASAGQATPALTGAVAAAVYQVSAPDQAGIVTVDLLIAAAEGPAVARQASTGQIALIETPRRS